MSSSSWLSCWRLLLEQVWQPPNGKKPPVPIGNTNYTPLYSHSPFAVVVRFQCILLCWPTFVQRGTTLLFQPVCRVQRGISTQLFFVHFSSLYLRFFLFDDLTHKEYSLEFYSATRENIDCFLDNRLPEATTITQRGTTARNKVTIKFIRESNHLNLRNVERV